MEFDRAMTNINAADNNGDDDVDNDNDHIDFSTITTRYIYFD